MKAAFRSLLTSDAVILAAASGGIDWGEQIQGAVGAHVLLRLIDGAEGQTQSGPDGLFNGRVQVDCFAPVYSDADALGKLIVAKLNGYRADGFRGIFHVGGHEGREQNSAKDFRVSLDFTIHHRSE